MNRARLLFSSLVGTFGIGALVLFGRCTKPDQPTAAPKAPETPEMLAAKAAQAQWEGFSKTVDPFLAKNCASCHGGENPEANIRLEGFTDNAVVDKKGHVLMEALKMLRQRKMPPSDQPQPSAEELKPVIAWLDVFSAKVAAEDLKNPGHVTMKRLNRTEYNNTVSDLLGMELRPADAFPQDDVGSGFDNIGDILSLPPVLMDKYLAAAEMSLDLAIMVKASVPPKVQSWDAGQLDGTLPKAAATAPATAPAAGGAGAGRGRGGRGPAPTGRVFPYNGEIQVEYEFATTGHYFLKVRGYGTAAQAPGGGGGGRGGAGAGRGRGAAPARPSVVFKLDGKEIDKPITVAADFGQPAVYAIETPIKIAKGKHLVTLTFVNGASKEESDVAEAAAKAAAEEAAAAAAAAATQNAGGEGAAPAAPAGGAGGAGGFAGGGGFGGAGGAGAGRGQGRGGGGRGGPPPSPTGKPTLGVLALEAEGPIDPSLDRMPESFKRVFPVLPSETVSRADAARQAISSFATRAYRRPVTDAELTRLMAYWSSVEADETFEKSISLALQPVLASPNFLYRVEGEPAKGDPSGIRALNEYELASRLSYFLWSTMPDEELMKLAGEGKLRQNLPAQVKRMLASPKAMALAENFGGQWLELRKITNHVPDENKFPEFNDELRAAMVKETQLFFMAILNEDRSVLEFLDADFTFVNARLARHYGIPDVAGEEFRRVSLTGSPRGGGGLLTQASVLTLTSYPGRTSPVLRGKWVLENLLDSAPPPPPPNVPDLATNDAEKKKLPLRQLMEAHRSKPNCISCHAAMDPIGFGLENFNAIGAWRDTDPDADNAKIDASGKLPDGQSFEGPAPLKKILLSRKDEFTECLVDRMLTYALGRSMDVQDRPRIKLIAEALKKEDYKFSALIMQIVMNDAFQKQGTKRGD